jgi:hypothetical protein
MSLKEILQKIDNGQEAIILNDGIQNWQAGTLLASLSELKLKVNAYFQSGLYIAEIDPKGYLGRVLYRVKSN